MFRPPLVYINFVGILQDKIPIGKKKEWIPIPIWEALRAASESF